jgi:hypothetical protein
MLLKKGTIVLVLLVLLVSVGIASASAAKANPPKNGDSNGLTIVSGYSAQSPNTFSALGTVSPMTSLYTIRQGQTNWHGKYISQGLPGYYCDLNWGNSANSLQLRIYTADGHVYGPYYDNADGRIDGRIYLWVSKSGGLPGGTYYHEVYGYRVSGVEDYTF